MTTSQYIPDTGYFNRYISLVETTDIIGFLEEQAIASGEFFGRISEEKSLFRYAEGKWTIREVAGHICDAERIFAYRGLRFARNDKTILNPFDENDFVEHANFNSRTMKELAAELRLIRESNLALFSSMSDEVLQRKGTAGIATLSVRDILYIIAGHQKHHLDVISKRYLDQKA